MIGREFTPHRFSCIMGMVIGAVGNSDISRAIARLKGDRSPFNTSPSDLPEIASDFRAANLQGSDLLLWSTGSLPQKSPRFRRTCRRKRLKIGALRPRYPRRVSVVTDRASRHSCSLFPVPCSLVSSTNQNFTASILHLPCMPSTASAR